MNDLPAGESTWVRRHRKAVPWSIACIAVGLLAACGQALDQPKTSASAGTTTPPSHEEPVLNFANFIEEIAPETLPAFTRETGITVNFDTYELNQVLESRLLVGSTGLDLVVLTNNYLERQIAAGVYQKLEKSQLPNLKNVDAAIFRLLERNDPGNQYAVPYVWGTHALGYDVAKVEAALGGPAPDSWALVFDSKYAAKLAQCGIIVVDSPWVMVSQALNYLGRDPNSERPEDLAAAMEVLMALRPYVREITASTVTRQLVEGEACIAVGVNADFHLARRLARDNGRNADIRYVIPKEGAMLWVDVLAIPADAPHPENAHRLVNYLLRPDVIAKVTESTGFANANAAATDLVPAELRSDTTIYPDAAARQRLRMGNAHTDAYSRQQNREFTRFRTGQ
jgi:putrescine transport system substrate-binding protein